MTHTWFRQQICNKVIRRSLPGLSGLTSCQVRTKNEYSPGFQEATNERLGMGAVPGIQILKAEADSSVGVF